MEQQLKSWIAASVCCLFAIVTSAQNKAATTPPWTSDKGYWVVESNI